jgi:hypothetical protein
VLDLKRACAELKSTARVQPEPTFEGMEEDPDPVLQERLAEERASWIKESVDIATVRLNLRLRLTPEQQQKLRTIMESKLRDGFRDPLLFDNPTQRDLTAVLFGVDPNYLDPELKELLSPSQYAEYESYKADERENAIETDVYADMMNLAHRLQLSEGQKDQMVGILYQNEVGLQSAQSLADPRERNEACAAQERTKQDALRKLLTPEQMRIYMQDWDDEQPAEATATP